MSIETLPTLKYCAVVLISVGLNKATKYLTFRSLDLVTRMEAIALALFSTANGHGEHSLYLTVMLYSLSHVGKQERT